MKNKLTTLIFVLWSAVCLQAQVTAVLTPPTGCEANGIIQLEIQGEGPFTIDWTEVIDNDDPTSIGSSTKEIPLEQWNNQEVIKELKAGTYCVTIKNAKCCEAKHCFELQSDQGSIKVVYKRNNTFCVIYGSDGGGKALNAPCEGEIEIGGMNNPNIWFFEWKMVEEPWRIWNTQNLKDLCNGTYILTATNKETGCEEKLKVEICCCRAAGIISPELGDNTFSPHPDPPFNPELKVCVAAGKAGALMVEYKATPPSSKGKADGSIVLIVTGGSKDPIYYKWEEKKTGKMYSTKDISNLSSGDYCYTVTNGCDVKSDCVPLYVCEEKNVSCLC